MAFAAGPDTFRVSTHGPAGDPAFDAVEAAAAYNATADELLVVWSGCDGTACEIFGRRLDAATGDLLGSGALLLSDMGDPGDPERSAHAPDVAWSPGSNEYLVVWLGDDEAADDEFEIYGQRLDASGMEIGENDFRISDMGPDGDPTFAALSPAVAWNPFSAEYLVVWSGDDDTPPKVEGELEIWAQRLDAAGAEVGANDFPVSTAGPDGSPGFAVFEPAVAVDPVTGDALVVWSGEDDAPPLVPGELEIFGQRLSAAGGEIGEDDFRVTAMGADGDVTVDALEPALAFDESSSRWLVVWSADEPDGEREIWARLLAQDGAGLTPETRLSTMGPDGDPDYDGREPTVGWNATTGDFLVAWSGDNNAPPVAAGELDVWARAVAGDGTPLGADFRVSRMGPDGDPAFDAHRPALAHDSTRGGFLAAWSGDDDEAPLVDDEFEIFGRLLGADLPPALFLLAPADGATFDEDDEITFTATANDLEDGDLSATVVWTSSQVGELGVGAEITATLPPGPHVIEASVTDSAGQPATDSIEITVTGEGCPFQLSLANEFVGDLRHEAAFEKITVGPSYTVTGTGDLTLSAGTAVVFVDGVSVEDGGRLVVELSTAACE